MDIDAKVMTVTLDSTDHWSAHTSKDLQSYITTRDIHFDSKKAIAFSVFEGTAPEEIRQYFENFKNYEMLHSSKTPTGVVAGVKAAPSSLNKIIDEITSNTASRLWLQSGPDEPVRMIIECPWDHLDIESMVTSMLEKSHLQTRGHPTLEKKALQIPIPHYDSEQFDEMDRRIAKMLLVNGYYLTPRPKGISQDKIAEKLAISKPTLEDRMRKIESEGISRLLGIRGFTDGEVDASWNILQNKIKPQS